MLPLELNVTAFLLINNIYNTVLVGSHITLIIYNIWNLCDFMTYKTLLFVWISWSAQHSNIYSDIWMYGLIFIISV